MQATHRDDLEYLLKIEFIECKEGRSHTLNCGKTKGKYLLINSVLNPADKENEVLCRLLHKAMSEVKKREHMSNHIKFK